MINKSIQNQTWPNGNPTGNATPDNLIENIDSHIQMPECILKNFVNKYQSFYYYDIAETNICFKIKRGHPGTLNAQKGYYSLETEQLLQKVVESPLGQIIKHIKNNDFSQPTPTPPEFQKILLTYLHSLIARSPHMYEAIEKHSAYLQFSNNFTEQEKNDFAVAVALEGTTNNSPFKDYIVTMLINKTEVPLLLPISGMYSYVDFICAPISFNRAIVLVKQNSELCSKLLYGKLCKTLLIEKESVIHQMNRFAIQAEASHNKRYVVSPDKILLETYLKELSLIQ